LMSCRLQQRDHRTEFCKANAQKKKKKRDMKRERAHVVPIDSG
jgi:hypothetical protein